MLSFATCENVPVEGGRGSGGGGLVEVEGRVVWGGYGGGVYMLDEVRSEWSRVADGGELWGTLAVCGGRLVWVGGEKGGVSSKEVKELRGGRWSHMPDMLGGAHCCLSDGGLLVVDDRTQQVLRSYCGKETGKSQKEADERYGEYEGTGIQWIEDWVRVTSGEPFSTAVVYRLVLYEEAMSKGYVETSVTKCLILGAAVLARLTSKHLLLQKDPPGQRVSTGVADNPVRAISFSLAGVVQVGQEEHDWFVVEDDQALLRVVGGIIRDGCVSMATHPWTRCSTLTPHLPVVNTTMDTGQQSRTASIEEELIHHINHSSETCLVAILFKPFRRTVPSTNHRVLWSDGKPVVLTRVSEIVEYHHKLLYRPAGGVAAKGDLVKFRDHGLLSVELLNKFSKHYTEGLFTPLDLLKLLVSVGGIAMVGGDEGGVYLMPALLPHLDSGQVSKYCQPAFILNQPFTLEVVSRQHVEYSSTKVSQFEDAFMCAGASCSSDAPHLATVVSKKKWKCSIRRHQRGDLCEGQLMWFDESGVTKHDPSATGTLPVSLDSEPSLQHLMEKVAAVIPSKYEMVGLQLGLTPAQLQGDTTTAPKPGGLPQSICHSGLEPDQMTSPLHHGAVVWGLCEPRLLTMAIVKDQSTSQQNLKMLETSRVEIDELPASIPWIVFDKARAVVELFHTRSVASQFHVTHTLTRKVTDVCISNGMAWSPGNTKMYHMDSGLRKLWSFNFDDVSSYLTNRQC
eukprot:Em0002g394a